VFRDTYYIPELTALRLTQAHKALLPTEGSKEPAVMAGLLKPLEDFHANNKGLIWLAGGVVSGGGLLWNYLAG
jgi:hypothetical protein